MNFQQLINDLHDPNPYLRVQSLRVLAMVEETRAIKAVAMVFRNDPEPGVRQVAQWAGSIIWNAQQRGHSTEAALEEFSKGHRVIDREELLVNSLQIDVERISAREIKDKDSLQAKLATSQMEWDRVEALREAHQRHKPTEQHQLAARNDDHLDLLDAGLSELDLDNK